MSPFRTTEGNIILGKKSSTFYAINPLNGELLHTYSEKTKSFDLNSECPSDFPLDSVSFLSFLKLSFIS